MRPLKTVANFLVFKLTKRKWVKEKTGTFEPPAFDTLLLCYDKFDNMHHGAKRQMRTDEAEYYRGKRDVIRDIMDMKL